MLAQFNNICNGVQFLKWRNVVQFEKKCRSRPRYNIANPIDWIDMNSFVYFFNSPARFKWLLTWQRKSSSDFDKWRENSRALKYHTVILCYYSSQRYSREDSGFLFELISYSTSQQRKSTKIYSAYAYKVILLWILFVTKVP